MPLLLSKHTHSHLWTILQVPSGNSNPQARACDRSSLVTENMKKRSAWDIYYTTALLDHYSQQLEQAGLQKSPFRFRSGCSGTGMEFFQFQAMFERGQDLIIFRHVEIFRIHDFALLNTDSVNQP